MHLLLYKRCILIEKLENALELEVNCILKALVLIHSFNKINHNFGNFNTQGVIVSGSI